MRQVADVAIYLILVVAAIAFLGEIVAPAVFLPAHLVFLRGACLGKLAFLIAGGIVALHVASRFGADNPIRPAWQYLGLGLVATALGQLVLAYYQFSPTGEAPFPTLGDVFFCLGYPLFVASLISFLRAYESAGYHLGATRDRQRLTVILSAVAVVIALIVLRPIVVAPAEPLARFLYIAYPLLDLVLLIPTVLLLKASLPLRGGEVWKAWAALLSGFLFMSAGDVLFAYFQALGVHAVDPLVHVTFLLSYGCLALGVLRQRRMLAA